MTVWILSLECSRACIPAGVHPVGMALKPLCGLQLDADFARMREMRHEEELTFIKEVKKVGCLRTSLFYVVVLLCVCFFWRLFGWFASPVG